MASDFERSSPPASGATVFLQVGLGIVLVFVLHALVGLAFFGVFGFAAAIERVGLGQEATVSVLVVFGVSSGAGATAVLPATLATAIGIFGLYLVPTTLATDRERGILRGRSVTPLSPTRLRVVPISLRLSRSKRRANEQRRLGRSTRNLTGEENPQHPAPRLRRTPQ